jgi:iron complex transport system ATP-binding protein
VSAATPHSPTPADAAPLLEASGISFGYGKRPALRGVSVYARAGEVVALLGPNGSGKSTLIRVLLGQLHGAGTVRWRGADARSLSPKALARRVAYLPQQPTQGAEQTVAEVVAMGRYPHLGLLGLEGERDCQVVGESMRAMGVEAFADRGVETLSGGQRQRVYLARCLAQEPEALLLDEPDSYLDLKRIAELARALRGLADGRRLAVVLATHDLHLAAAIADRVVLLDDGTVVAEGSPRAVLTRENLAKLFGVNAAGTEEGGEWGMRIVLPR